MELVIDISDVPFLHKAYRCDKGRLQQSYERGWTTGHSLSLPTHYFLATSGQIESC